MLIVPEKQSSHTRIYANLSAVNDIIYIIFISLGLLCPHCILSPTPLMTPSLTTLIPQLAQERLYQPSFAGGLRTGTAGGDTHPSGGPFIMDDSSAK